MTEYVTQRTHPDLDWKNPACAMVPKELLQSDAWEALTPTERDILLFAYSRRRYPPANRKKHKRELTFDYWHPHNEHTLTIPYVAVKEFFKNRRIAESTLTRAKKSLMACGFFNAVKIGGKGAGSPDIFRITNNWRLWKKGDPPVFTKAGMSREKGFCKPNSGVFGGNAKL